LEIFLHRSMIVEMVAGEVGEHGDIELEAVNPPLVETVRRSLHRDRSYSPIGQLAQDPLQLHWARSREAASTRQYFSFTADEYPKRSDRRARSIALVEEVAHDRSRRRLSVGAGDAEQSQVAGWISVRGCR